MNDKRQKNQLADGGNAGSNQQMVLAWDQEESGESRMDLRRGTESLMAKRIAESPAFGKQWMEEICGRDNCRQALARVKANRGSPGMDGMTVQQLPDFLKEHWRSIRRCGNWIDHWPAGPIGNTRSCAGICAGRHIGSRGYRDAIRRCGRTGRWACGVAPWREPYERRRSRTVLRGARGEIPRAYSPQYLRA